MNSIAHDAHDDRQWLEQIARRGFIDFVRG